MTDEKQDIWAQWLLKRRFAGDPQAMQRMLDLLYPVRDKVLSQVNLAEGQTLLDVGCGDGLIAFGALAKFAGCRVIFSDISQDLLEHARTLARENHLQERCRFICASADDLTSLEAGSVDAVTTRSVLIYVPAKQKAFQEFHRVLREGGQLSIFEPINRFGFPEPPDRFGGYDVTPVADIAQKVSALFDRLQPHDSDPMTDFDERDLLRFAEQAGFSAIHLELQVEIKPHEKADWSVLLRMAGNPKIPTLEEAIEQTLTPAEAERFISHLRPLVETGQGTHRMALAYLWAVK